MKETKLLAASWGRSFLAAALATYSIQGLNLKAMVASGVAALVPMVMRYLNPKDPIAGFGA